MPTLLNQWSGGGLQPLKNPEDARTDAIVLQTGSYAQGTVVGEIAATPGIFKTYATGNSDGSQNPTHILEYGVVVASDGTVTLSDTAGATAEFGATQRGVPAYWCGVFDPSALVGLDAGAITKLGRMSGAGAFIMYGC